MTIKMRALQETIQNLINVSDGLEYVRARNKNPELLRGQEYLVAAIEELKNAEQSFQTDLKKKANKQNGIEADKIEYLDNWKKKQEEKILQNYHVQLKTIEKDLQGNLKKQSVTVLRRDYFDGLQKIKDFHAEGMRGDQ